MWWHRDLAPAHTSRAFAHLEVHEIDSSTTHARAQPCPPSSPARPSRCRGWVHRRRELARVTFLVVRDRTGLAQVVLPAGTAVPPEETTVEVTGTATANPQAPGGVEVTERRRRPR